MSLRIYFLESFLRQCPNIHNWNSTAKKSLSAQEAREEEWNNFGIHGVKIKYDNSFGKPYIEFDPFRTCLLSSDNWKDIVNEKGFGFDIVIIDSWTGEQAAERIVIRRRCGCHSIALSRRQETVHLEMNSLPDYGEVHGLDLLKETIQVYEAIRRCKSMELPDSQSALVYAYKTDTL